MIQNLIGETLGQRVGKRKQCLVSGLAAAVDVDTGKVIHVDQYKAVKGSDLMIAIICGKLCLVKQTGQGVIPLTHHGIGYTSQDK